MRCSSRFCSTIHLEKPPLSIQLLPRNGACGECISTNWRSSAAHSPILPCIALFQASFEIIFLLPTPQHRNVVLAAKENKLQKQQADKAPPRTKMEVVAFATLRPLHHEQDYDQTPDAEHELEEPSDEIEASATNEARTAQQTHRGHHKNSKHGSLQHKNTYGEEGRPVDDRKEVAARRVNLDVHASPKAARKRCAVMSDHSHLPSNNHK